jgi:hypothetical protein
MGGRRNRVRTGGDAGAGALEYVGGILIAALVVSGAYLGVAGEHVQGALSGAVCTILNAGCQATTVADQTGQPPGSTVTGTDQSRRDAERGTRDNRRGRGQDKAPAQPGSPGTTKPGAPLGVPVPGTTVPTPQPPSWTPSDPGAGKHGSQSPGLKDRATLLAAEAAANAVAGKWPNASRNLLHYLSNSGEPLQQDVDQIMKDVPQFAQTVTGERQQLGLAAVQQAKARGATGPITFPVNTPWDGYYISPDQSEDWFYALGGVSYDQTGQVTVYPPSVPGGAWRYVVSTSVNLRDQYNWDHGKSTQIGPFTVTDDQMADLHRKGLAQEYMNYGQSKSSTTEGTVP